MDYVSLVDEPLSGATRALHPELKEEQVDEQVAKILAKGPNSVVEAEADWYIEQAELEFSKPAKTAFLLGVMFAASTARHSWKKTELYADAKEAAAPAPAYASSGNITPGRVVRRTEAKPSAAPVQVGDEVDPAVIREWLRGKGYQVSERGRISQALKDVYFAAMEEKTRKAAERAATRAGKSSPKPAGGGAAARRAARHANKPAEPAQRTRAVMPVAATGKSDRLTRNLPAGASSAPPRRRTAEAPIAQEVDF